MDEILDPLKPIAEIIGNKAVSAEYSDTQIFRNGSYYPGWKVTVAGVYRGASLTFSNRAVSLKEASELSLRQLKGALGLD